VQGNHYGGTLSTFRVVVWNVMNKRHKTSGLLAAGPALHSDCERLATLGLSF